MANSIYRPSGFRGKGDQRLPPLARRLRQVLSETQRGFTYDTLRLDQEGLVQLAGVLVEFAEDLHNDIGIWQAYERYNEELFGTPLPMTRLGSAVNAENEFHCDRFRHFLWVLYPALIDGLVFSPTHQDLLRVAEASSLFLADAFNAVPKDSGVKAFLRTDNRYGWDVKRKLIWLGTSSCLFRVFFDNYVHDEANGQATIGETDDFVCQECTRWSGLGVIDILAETIDVPSDARDELRNWHERHSAFYELTSVDSSSLDAVNLINDLPYRIRLNTQRHPFKRGQVVFGSLVPWRGEWYWSDEQKCWSRITDMNVGDLKQTMKRQNSKIVCRYDRKYEAQVRERAAEVHRASMEYYGKDLVIYPDGVSMAADWQRELRQQWESRSPEEVKDVIARHGLKRGRADLNLPRDLLEHDDGIGVFINPDEGKEIMPHFTSLVAGLKRKGEGLAEEHELSIQGLFDSPAVSPAFVRRVLSEYGAESVLQAFLLRDNVPNYWLEHLLRSRKGQFYRKRYPALAAIEPVIDLR